VWITIICGGMILLRLGDASKASTLS
jgi:hypothetical protein